MKRDILTYVLLVAGFITICSSWLSVNPATEYRYNELLNREEAISNSVSNTEWISNEMDGGMKALALIVVGIIAFVITTVSVFLVMLSWNVKRFKTVGYAISSAWVILGCALHGFVWLI